MKKYLTPTLLPLTTMLLLAACGGGGSESGESAGTPSGDTPTSPPVSNQPDSSEGDVQPGREPDLESPASPVSESPSESTTPAMPSPPPVQQLPSDVDTSNPGAVVKPLVATSSAVEGANTAAMAIDGNLITRWSSAKDDAAWIQFDFGAKTELGYLKLIWEAAYGKEYALQVSDDGETWYQLRYVTAGKGGTEEFFNLNANVRYVRLQGVLRSGQFGYSLHEVEFKSPGSDNSLKKLTTSVVPFPANGSGLAPTPAVQEPLEVLQFTLPDGTLVTRFGVIGRSRHGRERGEEWNEIGYGPNGTVDGNGNPVDKGPGAFLNFVKNYFRNRTWGFEIIDNSRVAGVTAPNLKVNEYFQQQQLPGGIAWFRGFDNPNVTGYGWMRPGRLVDDKIKICPVVPLPPNGKLASTNLLNNGCSLTVDDYPGHGDLGADGFPNGKTVSGRPLVVGDVIEVSPSFFSTPEAMAAIGDDGGLRYYAGEWTYVVGVGVRSSYGVKPRLMNAPLPASVLSGGIGSVSYDYADNAQFMFQQPQNNVGMKNMQRFTEGRRWIHTNLWTGDHNEEGNDRNEDAVHLQGAHFNQSSCFGCHINNGRGLAPVSINQRLDTMAVRTAAVDDNGQQVPHPTYGPSVQMNARSLSTSTPQDWGISVRLAGFSAKTVTLADGTTVELRKPKVSFDGPTPGVYSLRSAQPMIGMGLLEAIPDAEILSRVRTTPDADGVMGQANFAYDPETGAVRVGRYGWKASKVSLRHQASAAALLDMSVTSPVYPNRDCLAGPANCKSGKVEPGLSEEALQLITRYLGLLAVPAQRSLASGFPNGVAPLPYLDVNPAQVAAGAKVFSDIRCVACHVSEIKTGENSELAEVRNQTIKPYTDLLLHDLGADLADNLIEGQATGNLWRTSALWGIGYSEYVAGKNVKIGYLHDSRARTLTEAILWHGGEATRSRDRFQALSTADREALLKFLGSL